MYASPANEHWYVAAQSGRQTALILGPYDNHSDAAKHVDEGRLAVQDLYPNDMDAGFADYGVVRVISDNPLPGKLNGKTEKWERVKVA